MKTEIYGKDSSIRSVLGDEYVAYEQYTEVKGHTVIIRSVGLGSAFEHNPMQAARSLAELYKEGELVRWRLFDDDTQTLHKDWVCVVKKVELKQEGDHKFNVITLQRMT